MPFIRSCGYGNPFFRIAAKVIFHGSKSFSLYSIFWNQSSQEVVKLFWE